MTDLPKARRSGDAIPAQLVQDFRRQAKLTQEQLAERLGVRGGKPVVSGWETGRSACEGPAAEFLLHLLGRGNASLDIATLQQELSAVWNRVDNHVTTWRQVVAVPESPVAIAGPEFVSLFPEAALKNVRHGFPFTGVDLPGEVSGITQAGWLGCIPSAPDRQPTYLWMLKRDARFGYRERLWEDDPMSDARGQIDVGSMLKLSLETTYFLRRLAPICSFDPKLRFTLQVDIEGVRGRSLVDAVDTLKLDSIKTRWNEEHASASVSSDVAELTKNAFDVGLRLVSELAAQINSDYVRPVSLRQLLSQRAKQGHRLGFIDDVKL